MPPSAPLPPPPKAPPKTPPKAPPKPPPSKDNGAPLAPARTDFTVQRGIVLKAHKVVIYGTGGIGKSELCALLEQVGIDPLFLDVDGETEHLDVARVQITTWGDLRTAAQNKELVAPFGAVVIDSGTKAEEHAVNHVIETVPHEKGRPISRLEDYGWHKGYQHVYETFLLLLQDLDALVRAGKHVLITAHDCTAKVPHPEGEDFIQHQPRLQDLASGRASIRRRVKEWATHLFFLGYDIAVDDGKATGSGSRAIYCSETPTHMAKSRTLSDSPPIVYKKGDPELWHRLFGKE